MTWAPCPHGVRTRGKKNFILGFVEIPGLKAVVFPIVAYQVPPSLLPAVEQAT